MKKLLAFILIMIFSISFVVAQERKKTKDQQTKPCSTIGYLVDKMCGEKMALVDIKKSDAKAARHTKDCGLEEACSAEGYGLVTGGTFYKFDTTGDRKAKEYLTSTKKENNIKVEVIGTLNDKILTVESIKDFDSVPKRREKKK